MEELDKEIGLKLKKLREQKGLSLREAAKRIGVDHSYIHKIEGGKMPSLEKLKKLCDLYDFPIQSLFGEEVEVPDILKDLGVEWVAHVEKMKNKQLTPEEVEKMVEIVRTLKNLSQ